MSIEKITYRDPRPEELDDSGLLAGEDTRNVSDEYKRLPMEMIKQSLDEKRFPLVSIIGNESTDFNKSSVIRAANAYLADSVYLIGKRRYDRRGTVGAHHTEHIYHSQDWHEVFDHLRTQGYTVYAVENSPEYDPQVIYDVELPLKTAFVFGEENRGLSADVVEASDACVYIPQYGSVRSLNVSASAAVMFSEYSRRHRHHS